MCGWGVSCALKYYAAVRGSKLASERGPFWPLNALLSAVRPFSADRGRLAPLALSGGNARLTNAPKRPIRPKIVRLTPPVTSYVDLFFIQSIGYTAWMVFAC